MEQQMQYEDLRSFCVKRHDYVLELLEQIQGPENTIKKKDTEIENLERKNQDKDREIKGL